MGVRENVLHEQVGVATVLQGAETRSKVKGQRSDYSFIYTSNIKKQSYDVTQARYLIKLSIAATEEIKI